jgi:uncharacterized protein (TIGR02453 family)
MTDGQSFTGFSIDTLRFLNGIVHNNSKTWLEENRREYETVLLEPMKRLVRTLSPAVTVIDPQIDTQPKVGRTISRIFRDVRFSKDKSPLRANMWIVFKRPGDEGLHIPTFYFDLSFDHWSYGMGFYSATPEYMKWFRERILSKPEPFLEALGRIDPSFVLDGEKYARPPVKVLPPTVTPEQGVVLNPWLVRKSFYWSVRHQPGEDLFSPALADTLAAGFHSLGAVYRYLS